jgi:hypothetical protein
MNESSDLCAARQRRRSRLMVAGLALLFMGPIAFSLAFHRLGFEWRPAPHLAGELIEPPVAVPLAPDPQRRVPWKLVVPGGPACDASCLERARALRQLHVALGRYAEDFERVYVGGELPPGVEPGVRALEDAQGRIGEALGRAAAGRPVAFFLLDPGNHAIVRYLDGYDGRAVLHDLTRLARRTQRP